MTVNRFLEDLLGVFFPTDFIERHFEVVSPDALDEPYRSLLVHDHHMTVNLEEYHGAPVRLSTVDERHAGDDYARKLALSVRDGEAPVMIGAMRFHLEYCQAAVREEILAAIKPLGRILIEHEVMRRLESVAYLRVRWTAEFQKAFAHRSDGDFAYGRIAVIFCDEQPAVELLEVIPPVSGGQLTPKP